MAAVNTNPPNLTEQDIQEFWNRVDTSPGHGPQGECWKWTKSIVSGYGSFTIQRDSRIRRYYAHRLAFFLATGCWSTLFICHACDWRLCCNPAHLFEATQKENLRDMVAKGREPHGERNPRAKLTTQQVIVIRSICWKGSRNHRVTAQHYGVSVETIKQIVSRARWKHI